MYGECIIKSDYHYSSITFKPTHLPPLLTSHLILFRLPTDIEGKSALSFPYPHIDNSGLFLFFKFMYITYLCHLYQNRIIDSERGKLWNTHGVCGCEASNLLDQIWVQMLTSKCSSTLKQWCSLYPLNGLYGILLVYEPHPICLHAIPHL